MLVLMGVILSQVALAEQLVEHAFDILDGHDSGSISIEQFER